MTEHIFYIV